MEKQLIGIEEIHQRTGMSKAYAYKLIRRLSDESTPRDSSPSPARSASTTSSRGCSASRLPREVRPLSVNRDPERETWMLQARHPNA